MFVKICGITRAEDAAVAVEAGANAIGFIFWPKSPRFIDPYRAARIVAALPAFVTPVGVFVNQPVEYVSGVASLVKLGAVQLHGDETPDTAARLAYPIVRAVAMAGGGPAPQVEQWPASVTLLLDAFDERRRGGTGTAIDWGEAAAMAARRRVLLAGGLTPENVVQAVEHVRPFGIDVSSGVEQKPGVKDHGRLRALFEAVHAIHDHAARS